MDDMIKVRQRKIVLAQALAKQNKTHLGSKKYLVTVENVYVRQNTTAFVFYKYGGYLVSCKTGISAAWVLGFCVSSHLPNSSVLCTVLKIILFVQKEKYCSQNFVLSLKLDHLGVVHS